MMSFNEFTEKIAKGLGYEYELSPTWYEDYKSDEFTIFQAFSVLRAKRLSNEELFYYQRMQYLRYIPHYKKEVLANRAQFNITDTLIKVLKGGFLKLESPYGSSFVTILPVGKFPVQFNGFHLGEFIQRLNFPVELRIKAEFIDTGKIKGRMGRSNNALQKHHGRGRKYRYCPTRRDYHGFHLPKGLNEESRKQGGYHRIWSLSDCLCF